MKLLEMDGLGITLPTRAGTRPLVDGVTVDVEEGEVVGIAGESGSGKTLTALAMLGFLPDGARHAGQVRFDGTDVLSLSRRQRQDLRGNEIAMVFQDATTALHPMINIETQLTEHLRAHRSVSKSVARDRAAHLLEQVRMPDPERVLKSFPHHFSGGMRQRIAIAMALACEPRLLIADEPTTALDVTVQAGILRLLDDLRRDTGMAIVFITHDLAVMNVVADRLYIMYAGRVVESGVSSQVLDRPRHPYTRALLDALPEAAHEGGRKLAPIPGDPASPETRPAGCAFHPRCTFAEDSCRVAVPPLEAVTVDRDSACPVDPFATGVLIDPRTGGDPGSTAAEGA